MPQDCPCNPTSFHHPSHQACAPFRERVQSYYSFTKPRRMKTGGPPWVLAFLNKSIKLKHLRMETIHCTIFTTRSFSHPYILLRHSCTFQFFPKHMRSLCFCIKEDLCQFNLIVKLREQDIYIHPFLDKITSSPRVKLLATTKVCKVTVSLNLQKNAI